MQLKQSLINQYYFQVTRLTNFELKNILQPKRANWTTTTETDNAVIKVNFYNELIKEQY